MTSRGPKSRSLSVRLEAIRRVQRGENLKKVAKEYQVCEQSVRNWLKQKELIGETADQLGPSALKCTDQSHALALRRAVYKWYVEQKKKDLPVTKYFLKNKAIELNAALGGPADFRASEGWLWNFKKAIGVLQRKENSTEETISADTGAVQAYRSIWHSVVEERGLSPDQVYNADESGLYFKCLPSTTLDAKEELSAGGVKDKNRFSVLFCSNATGDHKLPLLIIGKTVNFIPVSKESGGKLPVVYTCSEKAWMNSKIFEAWVREQFEPEVKQYLESKNLPLKAVLLVDNAASHKLSQKTIGIVSIEYLPAGVSSSTQPMEQGAISLFRRMYRLYLLQRLEKENNYLEELKTLSIVAALNLAAKAWNDIKPGTLAKCWRPITINSKRPNSPSSMGSLCRQLENELIQSAQKLPGLEYVYHKEIVNWCESDPLDVSGDISEEEGDFLNPNRSSKSDPTLTINHEEVVAALDRVCLYAKQFPQWAPYLEVLHKMKDEAVSSSSANIKVECVKEEILSDDDVMMKEDSDDGVMMEVMSDNDEEPPGYEEKIFLECDVKIESSNELFNSEDNACTSNVDQDPLFLSPDRPSGYLVQQEIIPEDSQCIIEETRGTDNKSILDQYKSAESPQSIECVNGTCALDSVKDEERGLTVMYNSMEDGGDSSCSFLSKEGESPHEILPPTECFSSSNFVESTSLNRAVTQSSYPLSVPHSGDPLFVPHFLDIHSVPHSGDRLSVIHAVDPLSVPHSGNLSTITHSGNSVNLQIETDSLKSTDNIKTRYSCEQKYSSDSDVKDHQRFYKIERPFKCDQCERRFKRRADLECHERDHTGEESFECSEGGKKIPQKQKLFRCEHCEMIYSREADFLSHSQIPRGGIPFECNQCIRKFCSAYALKLHQDWHSVVNRIPCNKCGKKFRNKTDVRLHKKYCKLRV